MKVAWKGDADTRAPFTEVFGTTFPEREPVDISHLPLDQQRRIVANPNFDAADKAAQELASAPVPMPAKAAQAASAGDLAAVWSRLEAAEKDSDTLRKAVSELAPLRKRFEALEAQVEALTAKAEKPKEQK